MYKVGINETNVSGIDDYKGFIKDMLDELGVKYDIIVPEDNRYGSLDPSTGRWNGMIGLIQNRVRFVVKFYQNISFLNLLFCFF